MKQMPECPRADCQFTESMSRSTLAYYPPVYDKNGVNINPDGNTTTSTLNCLTCGKWWSCISQLGETLYAEVK